MDAAMALTDVTTEDGPRIAQLVALRLGDSTIRLVGLTAKSDGATRNALNSALQSFSATDGSGNPRFASLSVAGGNRRAGRHGRMACTNHASDRVAGGAVPGNERFSRRCRHAAG